MSATTNCEDTDVIHRRSDRKRVSTLIKIDGHNVLRQNNYTVTSSSYIVGTNVQELSVGPKYTKKVKTVNSTSTSTTLGNPVVRSIASHERARMVFNEQIKKCIQDKEIYRQNFVLNNIQSLQPFMNEKTIRQWKQVAAATSNSKSSKKQQQHHHQRDLFVQPERVTGGEMRDYQLTGLNFMINMHQQNLGMILGDEMGLGKTLQTISLLCHLKDQIKDCGPSLVVCPLSVLYSWCAEVQKWAPSLKLLRLHASSADDQKLQRTELTEHILTYDVVLTTYDMLKAPQLSNMWSRQYFRYLVLDEGHKIKCGETILAHAVRKIHAENRLLLTGTPLQNNLSELVQLLNFLQPDVFTAFEPFENAFDITNNLIDQEKMAQSQEVLALFMLRRLKDQVEKLMPKKIETKVYCPLSNNQVALYKKILTSNIAFLTNQEDKYNNGTTSATAAKVLANLFMQLRKACLHPFLFDGSEDDIASTTVGQLIGASGKLAVLDLLLLSLFQKGHRCVIFSQFTSVIDILEDYCTMRGWHHFVFDGRTPRAKRNYFVTSFNRKDSPVFLFLMSTRSGSMGLNLQTADTVILFDSDFNPQMDLQAQARVHRIGQKKTVHVYRLIAGGTVEERLIERADKKLLLDQMVNRDRDHVDNSKADEEGGLSLSTMLKDIKFGSSAVFGDSSLNTLPTKNDIAFITDRTRSEGDSYGKLKGDASHKGESFDLGKELSDGQVFQGINFRKLRTQKENLEDKNVPSKLRGIRRISLDTDSKRTISNRIIMVNGKDSGYGATAVPVLASNNYDLDKGESSVFDRELAHNVRDRFAVVKNKKKERVPEHQDTCQVCGDGGLLHLCSRCPVAVHKECWPKIVQSSGSCPHHSCSLCLKSNSSVGGLLYPCQSCAAAYCEDCLPLDSVGFRFLGPCDRFEALGFDSLKMSVYIHCSAQCEQVAKTEFGWQLPKFYDKASCPPAIDLSADFGGNTTASSPRKVLSISSPDKTVCHSITSVSSADLTDVLTGASPDTSAIVPDMAKSRPGMSYSNPLCL